MALKLNLGSGDSRFDGFTSVDLYDSQADVMADICELPFGDGTVDEIVAYQVVEHIPYQKSTQMFEEMYRVLGKGGTVTLETPDILYISKDIVKNGITNKWIHSLVGEYYRPWDKDRYEDWENVAAAIHRNPWDLRRIKTTCEPLGFKVGQIEPTQIKVEENLACRLTKL